MALKDGPADGYLYSKGYWYCIFTLLFLLYMVDFIDRMVVVSLFPFLKADFGLSDTQCGLLVSKVYWSIVVPSVPISAIIDRWSRGKSIGLMALFWSGERDLARVEKIRIKAEALGLQERKVAS